MCVYSRTLNIIIIAIWHVWTLENAFEKEGSEHIVLMHLQNSNRSFVMKNNVKR